jgi:hypothetical protein
VNSIITHVKNYSDALHAQCNKRGIGGDDSEEMTDSFTILDKPDAFKVPPRFKSPPSKPVSAVQELNPIGVQSYYNTANTTLGLLPYITDKNRIDPTSPSIYMSTPPSMTTSFGIRLYALVDEAPEDVLAWDNTGTRVVILDVSRLEIFLQSNKFFDGKR